jgi:ABC-type sugar transport system substrate-binding protein
VALAGVATVGLVAALLSGCSSSSNGAGSSAAAAVQSSTSSGVSAALKALKTYEDPDPVIDVPALSATPPKGKKLDFVTCAIPLCIEIQQGVQAAASKLGWTVKVINGGLTPATFISAMDEVVQDAPDAALGIGILPNSAIQTQLSALAAKHIPWIAVASPSDVGPDMLANFESSAGLAVTGQVVADWVVADSNGSAKVAYYWDPTETQSVGIKNDFVSQMSKLCPKCSVSVQVTNFTTGIGTTDPGQVVSYLQAHPSTNYLVIGEGDAITGIPQALSAAGLSDKVKIATRGSTTTNIKDIAHGSEAMAVTDETTEIGWSMVDAVARHFLGDPITDPTAVGVVHVITKSNLPADLNVPYTVPNYQSYFLKAWHL